MADTAEKAAPAANTTSDGSDSKHRERIAAHYKGNEFFFKFFIFKNDYRIGKNKDWFEMVSTWYAFGQLGDCCSCLLETHEGKFNFSSS